MNFKKHHWFLTIYDGQNDIFSEKNIVRLNHHIRFPMEAIATENGGEIRYVPGSLRFRNFWQDTDVKFQTYKNKVIDNVLLYHGFEKELPYGIWQFFNVEFFDEWVEDGVINFKRSGDEIEWLMKYNKAKTIYNRLFPDTVDKPF